MSEQTKTETNNVIRERIVSVLKVYPVLNTSMLQLAIGSSLPKMMWEPVLQCLISDGLVSMDTVTIENPRGRTRTVPVMKLNN